MPAAITAILALLTQFAPTIAGAGGIGQVINVIAAILPPAFQLAKEEIPVIKSLIADIKGNSASTADQLAELDLLDARCDAIFDDALKSAEAEDAAQT